MTNRGGRAARSSAAQSLGSSDPRLRRNAQSGATPNDLGAGLGLDDRGRIEVTLDVQGALYTLPNGDIAMRLGDGLMVAPGSPAAVRLVEDDGTVQVTSKGLRARLTASQVVRSDGVTVEADLDAKQDLSEKGQPSGYLGIESTGYVDQTKLGSLYGGTGAKHLADDGKWKTTPTAATLGLGTAAFVDTSSTGAESLIPIGSTGDVLDASWIPGKVLIAAGYAYLDMSGGATTVTTAEAKDDASQAIILSWSWKGSAVSNPGVLYVSALTDSTSFDVSSTDATSAGYFSWAIFNTA